MLTFALIQRNPCMSNIETKDWFETWFDTPYYHRLYKHRNDEEAQQFIDKLVAFLQPQREDKCLDLACGKGRHAKYLSEKGLNVTGVDLSANSISQAKKHEQNNLRFDVHDMREVYKKNTFDYVFNLFTSFGYFDAHQDNLKVLNAIRQSLVPKGKVVIDFMNVNKSIANLIEEEVKEVDGIPFYIQRKFDGEHIHKFIKFEDKGKSYEFKERVQALQKNDFEALLKKSNLKLLSIFGDYKLSPFDQTESDRLIIIAEKNE